VNNEVRIASLTFYLKIQTLELAVASLYLTIVRNIVRIASYKSQTNSQQFFYFAECVIARYKLLSKNGPNCELKNKKKNAISLFIFYSVVETNFHSKQILLA